MGKPCKHRKYLEKMKPCPIPKEEQEKRVEHVRKVLQRRDHTPEEIAEVLGESI